MSPEPDQQPLNIELPAELETVYSNLAIINHSPSEIVVDFARMLPNVPKARIYARVLMTPLNAKLLLLALQDNLSKYEAKYGEVRIPSESGFQAPPGLFGGRKTNE